MDKLLDAIAKYVPAPAMTTILAIAVGFWAVHYWRGFRDYSDTLRDRTFLSLTIVAAAGLCLYAVNRSPTLPVSAQPPILLVPYFEGDERDQYRTAFTSQLEQAFAKAGEPRSVYAVPVFLAEHESAIQSANRYGARAAVYGPRVIREKDSIKLCFHVALTMSNSAKPYAMVPVELPAGILDELANSLLAVTAQGGQPAVPNPLLSRLENVENQLAALRSAIDHATASQRPHVSSVSYRRKFAIAVGVNEIAGTGFKLQFAESDAQTIAHALDATGFETTLLIGKSASKSAVLKAFDNVRTDAGPEDLVIFFYAGNSTAQIGSASIPRVLHLFLADSRADDETGALTINDLRAHLEQFSAKHRLAIVDGCHGTSGLKAKTVHTGLAAAASPANPITQIFAASGDEEFAMESAQAGGGVFTQSLVKILTETHSAGEHVWMHDLVARTIDLVRKASDGRQNPKLVTVSGDGEILWSGDGTRSPAQR